MARFRCGRNGVGFFCLNNDFVGFGVVVFSLGGEVGVGWVVAHVQNMIREKNL